MGKDESELVPMNKEPGYGGTDAEESKKPEIDISDFKPAAPTWVLDCAQINRASGGRAARASMAWRSTRRFSTRRHVT